MAQEILMTEEGYKKLSDELIELKTVKRTEIAETIKVALGFGDLSENSEYHEAKDEQGRIEGRIAELEEKLKHVRIVSKDEISKDTVAIGSIVTIDDDGFEMEYKIVSSAEKVEEGENAITDTSPVGKALFGHKVGDVVKVEAPAGSFEIKIVNIRI